MSEARWDGYAYVLGSGRQTAVQARVIDMKTGIHSSVGDKSSKDLQDRGIFSNQCTVSFLSELGAVGFHGTVNS